MLGVDQILTLDEEYHNKLKNGQLPETLSVVNDLVGVRERPVMQKVVGKVRVVVFAITDDADREAHKADDRVTVWCEPLRGEPVREAVVTEWRKGPLQNRRVVRGREEECQTYYADLMAQQVLHQAVDILKDDLELSPRRAYQELCAQACGHDVLLPDVAAVVVRAGEVGEQYPDLFNTVTFDRRPWYKRRVEVLSELSDLVYRS
jgi:hypothetical protein